MSFDPADLFIELIVGAIGLALFMYGKKSERWPHLVAGLLLMVYPYFVDGGVQMFGVGAAIILGLAGALWLGW